MLPKAWNDVLAMVILVGAPLLVVFFKLPDIAIGTLLAGWTLVIQFYFRKVQGEANP